MAKLQHCAYVLLSLKDKKFYIGYTIDLKQRSAIIPTDNLKLLLLEDHLN